MLNNYICIDIDTLKYIWDGLLCCLYSIEKNTPLNTTLVIQGDRVKESPYLEYLSNNFRIKEFLFLSIPSHIKEKIYTLFSDDRVRDMWKASLLKIYLCRYPPLKGHILVHDYDMNFTSNFNIDEIENYKSNILSARKPNNGSFRINNGFFICNTENSQKHYEKMESVLLNKNFRFRLYDEGVVNKYIYENKIKITIIPSKYNRLLFSEDYNEESDAVIHYNGPKPWRFGKYTFFAYDSYQETYRQNIFSKRALKNIKTFYNFFNDMKLNKKYIPYQ